jgi:hypothetical protein
MLSRLTTLFILCLAIFLIQGCADCNQERERWLNPKYKVLFELEQQAQLTQEDVLARIGSPDAVLSLAEFLNSMPKHYDMEVIVRELAAGDVNGKCIQNNLSANKPNIEFRENCRLWLYDESLHFKEPYKPGPFTMCAYVGFSCFCFYVEDKTIVGGTALHNWHSNVESVRDN